MVRVRVRVRVIGPRHAGQVLSMADEQPRTRIGLGLGLGLGSMIRVNGHL